MSKIIKHPGPPKRGKKRARQWQKTLPYGLLGEVLSAIDGSKDGARPIFSRFNLDEYVCLRTFQRFVSTRRRQTKRQRKSADEYVSESKTTIDEMCMSSVRYVYRKLMADEIPNARLGPTLTSILGFRLLLVREEADRRAREIHEAKMSEARKKLKKAVGDLTKSKGCPPSKSELYQLIDDYMRGKADE